jgi:hypothetical protein
MDHICPRAAGGSTCAPCRQSGRFLARKILLAPEHIVERCYPDSSERRCWRALVGRGATIGAALGGYEPCYFRGKLCMPRVGQSPLHKRRLSARCVVVSLRIGGAISQLPSCFPTRLSARRRSFCLRSNQMADQPSCPRGPCPQSSRDARDTSSGGKTASAVQPAVDATSRKRRS